MRISQHVRRGISFLDKHEGEWWNMIKLDTLNINDCYDCIIGQMYGDYTIHKYTLARKDSVKSIDTTDWCIINGFTALEMRQVRDIEKLNRLWKFAIRKRQNAKENA